MVPTTFRYRRYLGWRKHWLIGLLLAMFLFSIFYLFSGGSDSSNKDWPADLRAVSAAASSNLPSLLNVSPALSVTLPDQLPVLSGPGSRHFSASLNASRSAVAELMQDPMKLEELHAKAIKTLGYLSALAKPSEFDANAGSCRCGRIAEPCSCCARLTAGRLRLGQTACVQFAYLVHRQAMRTRLLLAGSLLVEKLLSAANMPSALCAGEHPRLELCARFRNASYTVQMHSRHKTRLSGCLELLVNLANSTIYAYPLGCFQAQGPSDPVAVPAVGGGSGRGRSADAVASNKQGGKAGGAAVAGQNLHMDNWVP